MLRVCVCAHIQVRAYGSVSLSLFLSLSLSLSLSLWSRPCAHPLTRGFGFARVQARQLVQELEFECINWHEVCPTHCHAHPSPQIRSPCVLGQSDKSSTLEPQRQTLKSNPHTPDSLHSTLNPHPLPLNRSIVYGRLNGRAFPSSCIKARKARKPYKSGLQSQPLSHKPQRLNQKIHTLPHMNCAPSLSYAPPSTLGSDPSSLNPERKTLAADHHGMPGGGVGFWRKVPRAHIVSFVDVVLATEVA